MRVGEGAVEYQSRLTPQMKQYEDFATGELRWLPYVMFFNRPNYRSAVLNTDRGGFRISHGPTGPHSVQEKFPDGQVSLILGASPAFGFGASSDASTISSLLSHGPNPVPWLNLAAPAFNSTQETVLFMLHRHQLPDIRDIVVFSGLNDLVVAGLPLATGDYGQFFFSGEFFRQLGAPDMGQRLGQPGWARGVIGRAAKRMGRTENGPDTDTPAAAPDLAGRISTAVRNTARGLDRLAELAAPTRARLHYVLQPTASWTGKPYTPEEKALINEADTERAAMWRLFAPVLAPSVHAEYAERLAAVCKERGLSFLDTSTALGTGTAADRWLFVDQAHLTDEGNLVTAELMRTELGL